MHKNHIQVYTLLYCILYVIGFHICNTCLELTGLLWLEQHSRLKWKHTIKIVRTNKIGFITGSSVPRNHLRRQHVSIVALTFQIHHKDNNERGGKNARWMATPRRKNCTALEKFSLKNLGNTPRVLKNRKNHAYAYKY